MLNQPNWITQDLTPYDIAAVIQGGCASGAYMPAVDYYIAGETMNEHGDDVLDFINENMGEIPKTEPGESWRGMAVYYLSIAVELWCSSNEEIADWDNDESEL